jgi:hypothetical protein
MSSVPKFEQVVVVIEEAQSPIGTRPYEFAPHRLKFGDRLEEFGS